MSLLSVHNLSIAIRDSPDELLVRDLSFSLSPGEFMGLVGESGSGKTLTARSIIGLLPNTLEVTSGEILYEGQNVLQMHPKELRQIRGAQISMVFQEPGAALNPVFSVGFQIIESIRAHEKVSRKAARDRAVALLRRVAIDRPQERIKAYPHQLSGGQLQRVMIAIALASSPRLLLADEPTTALDVTVQAQILDLLDDLRSEMNLAVLLITHDLRLVASRCDRSLVMYCGELVENLPASSLFRNPRHPYTVALARSTPQLGRPISKGNMPTIGGTIPDPRQRPAGCAFHPRCENVMDRCRSQQPTYRLSEGGGVRCFLEDQ